MTEQSLTVTTGVHPLLLLMNGDKDIKSRLAAFIAWQGAAPWYQPDLARWRDELLAEGKAKSTVAAYLGTVRGAYKHLLISNDVRDQLYAACDPAWPPERRKAWVEEILTRLQNSIHPTAASVKLQKVQDDEDEKHIRMTSEQAKQLLGAPGLASLLGLRDTSIIALLLCTGIREDELCNLDVPDLRQRLGGELALRVQHGKGDKKRMVPYGQLDWCLILVEAWMGRAGIRDGAVFRGMTRGNVAREGRLTTRSVRRIVSGYPIIIGGRPVQVHPHDCRRTYARLLYESGMDLLAIKQNLGHEDIKTTEGYIGKLDASARRARPILEFNVTQLSLL
jgi:integrase